MKVKKYLLLFLCTAFSSLMVRADEGMWLPQLLEQLNEKRMKSLGMKISARDIYDINKGSLKDAIVSFGGFCTGEIISDEGLVLTNHHCGYDAIQNHSTIDKNFLRDGFWARNHTEELNNPGLFVTFIVRIDEVTKEMLRGVDEKMSEPVRQSQLDKNINTLKEKIKAEPHQNAFVKSFYEGNKYYMFITETFKDVRLVGAPPSAVGNFGRDTDNWMWPRHTGDFSLFRIYAGKDNKPAEYSPQNKPYKPKRSLAINIQGLKEGDFTMVFGFPGKTTQYLPSEAVDQIVNINDPAKILIRDKALAVIDKYMRADEAIKIQYASKYAGISNAWKKWQGEVLGLSKTQAVHKKKEYEQLFLKRLNASEALKAKYGNVLQDLIKAYEEIKPYALARDYYLEITSKIELFTIINRIKSLKEASEKDAASYGKELSAQIEKLNGIYKEYNTKVDEDLFATLMELYLQNQEAAYVAPQASQQFTDNKKDYRLWAAKLYSQSFFVNEKKVMNALSDKPSDLFDLLQQDEAARLVMSITDLYNKSVAPALNQLQNRINQLQRQYMQAQMEVMKDKTFYPDANGTLRVAYGKVKGYEPADGKKYFYYTYLDGVIEKYKPGDYEFDVPQKLINLYKARDYGQYGEKGKMPLCFIATNHTTGGNSGSPALDASGNLVGLNFDRVWEGTMSDINYDPSICRNIMVDARYILFIIDKFAGAKHLIEEMKIVGMKK